MNPPPLTNRAPDQLRYYLESEIRRLRRKIPGIETRWHIQPDCDPSTMWFFFTRKDIPIPEQGWKLHLAASLSTAIPLLKRVLIPLLLANSSFKVVASLQHLSALNQGHYGWSQIGKYMTIYPSSPQEAVRLAHLLDQRTRSLATLNIPSDRPLHPQSTVHYRYGSFRSTLSIQEPDGRISPAIRTPSGALVADRRKHHYEAPSYCLDPFNPDDIPSGIASPTQRLLVERYLLARIISATPQHTLYLAIDLREARSCVIKGPGTVWQQGSTPINQSLLHEAKILTTLSTLPQIPTLYTYFEQENNIFLVLEDISGESLQDYMKNLREQGQLPDLTRVLDWLAQLTLILKAIHSHGLVYADLKAANIIIGSDGQLRLVDFELTDHRSSTSVNTFGTRGYSSPQRLHGLPLDTTDDIYSLGALLYFLVTAADPTEAPHPSQLLRREPCWFSAAGTRLQDLIARCTSAADTRPSLQQIEQISGSLDHASSPQPCPPPPSADTLNYWQSLSLKLLLTLQSTACENSLSEGIFWRSTHPVSYGIAARDINTGNAGILLALSELVAAHPGSDHSSLLMQAAHYLLHAPFIHGQPLPGLYIGEAGVGAALLRASQVLHDETLLIAAARRSTLVASLPYQSPDLFHGTAGRLRFHLWLWDATGEQEHLQHALSCGRHLLETAYYNEQAETFWTIPPGYHSLSGQTYLGYAHGTSGIADALLDLFVATGDEQYLPALHGAARWLGRQAGTENMALWPKRENETTTTSFWCHGAAGIGQFFLHMAQHSLSAFDLALRAANAVASTTLWANPTQCHGLAGNIEFLLDVYQMTRQQRYRDHAFALAQCLQAFEEEQHGHCVFPSEIPTVYTPDYMVGYAGVAVCALRLASPHHQPRQLSRAGFRHHRQKQLL